MEISGLADKHGISSIVLYKGFVYMITIAGRFVKNSQEIFLTSIQNPSTHDVSHYVQQISTGNGQLGVYSDRKDIEKLDIYVEKGYIYFQLIDSRSEWGCREYINPKVSLSDNTTREVDQFSCTEATITRDIELVIRIINEFVTTNDVSEELMPM